ncbi:MAG: GntR family transcriptional regulator [Sulfitobacter sp.]
MKQDETICMPLPRISQFEDQTVADQVFEAMRLRIHNLTLPPLTKISEAEVAAQMGASRQPVREAFKRLAKLGLLVIRPQSGTTVSLISEKAVVESLYIRTALEEQVNRTACTVLSDAGLNKLSGLLDQQQVAVEKQERALFHGLDDRFHREICGLSGLGYVWDLIQEHKAHMDRIRMISLSPSWQKQAFEDHVAVFEALKARDPDAAAQAIAAHLTTINRHIERVKAANHSWFLERDI